MVIIVMGVSGCGKSTIGKKLATRRGIPFFDADDYHPEVNIEKMRNGVALNDEDRRPWLELLADKISQKHTNSAVLACSALKESYRTLLSSKNKNILWVYLSGSYELILERIEKRDSHYMKSTLLKSQLEALEIPNYGLHISIDNSIDEIINQINSKIN